MAGRSPHPPPIRTGESLGDSVGDTGVLLRSFVRRNRLGSLPHRGLITADSGLHKFDEQIAACHVPTYPACRRDPANPRRQRQPIWRILARSPPKGNRISESLAATMVPTRIGSLRPTATIFPFQPNSARLSPTCHTCSLAGGPGVAGRALSDRRRRRVHFRDRWGVGSDAGAETAGPRRRSPRNVRSRRAPRSRGSPPRRRDAGCLEIPGVVRRAEPRHREVLVDGSVACARSRRLGSLPSA